MERDDTIHYGVVLASDGVWDKVSNQIVAKICEKPFFEGPKDAKKAALDIASFANRKWDTKPMYMDDITCMVVFLKI